MKTYQRSRKCQPAMCWFCRGPGRDGRMPDGMTPAAAYGDPVQVQRAETRLTRWSWRFGAAGRLFHSLGDVDRLGETADRAAALRQHGRGELPVLGWEEVPVLDLGQPAGQLFEILLALFHLGEGVLLGLGLLADLVEQGVALFGELLVLTGPVGLELLRDAGVDLGRAGRHGHNECRPALGVNALPRLLEELRVRARGRQHPHAIDYRRGAGRPQPPPE